MYEVNEGDTFDFRFYPEVQSELVAIARHLKQMPGDHKAEIRNFIPERSLYKDGLV